MGLRGKVAATTILTAVLAAVLVAALSTLLVTGYLQRSAQGQLAAQAKAAGTLVRALRASDRPVTDRLQRPAVLERALQQALGQVDADGTVVSFAEPSGPATELLDEDALGALRAGSTVQGRGTVSGDAVVYAAAPTLPQAAVLAWRPLSGVQEASRQVARFLLLAALAGAAVAALVGVWVGGRLARPVLAIADAVHGIASGRLDGRVPGHVSDRPDEIGELGRDVDAMAETLAAARERERGFFLSVGHELRTPLTNIRGYAEGLLDGRFEPETSREEALGVVHDESLRLSRLVADVMTLAQLDAGAFEIEPSEGDIAGLVDATAAAARTVADRAAIEVIADARSCPIVTDPDRLRQILDNLVANALRVTPGGGQVRVWCRPTDDGGARVGVTDSGPGIAEDDVPRAFERYGLWRKYRGVREVGTGLGLSIVAELASRLGGEAHVDPGGDGRGATFWVDLPPRPGS